MPRIAPLEPPYAAEIQQHFEQVMRGRPPLLLFRTIATSTRAWQKFRAGSLLDRGPLSLRHREIVIDRTCARCGCEYEWGVHVAVFAQAAGLSHSEVAALLAVPFDASKWNDEEASLVRTVDVLHEHATLDAADFAALRANFSADACLEVLMLAGFYRMVSYIANGLALPLEADAARFVDFQSS